MGLWGTLAKIGGIAAAPFTGGASLALTLGGIGAGIAGDIIQSKQTSKAVKAQRAATGEARTLRGQGYTAAQQALSPYAAMGTGALSNLGAMVGRPSPTSSVPFGNLVGLPSGSPSGAPSTSWQDRAAGGIGAPRPTGATVIVRAPTGETRQVPAEQADHWQSRGALIVRT